MTYLENFLVGYVAILHFAFLYLEMFLWTKPSGLKIFNQSLEKSKASASLAANQGLYNGFLASGLLWSILHPNLAIGFQLKCFFLSCVTIAGLYGGYSVKKRIILIQAMPALLALSMVLVRSL